MYLLLIRHGIAAPLSSRIVRDEDRPLTAQGRKRFHQVAVALVRLAPCPRAILTSPLLRARQTAEIAAQTWGHLRPQVVPALATGDLRGIRRALADFADEDTVVLVGHEDWLSQFAARLLGSRSGRAFHHRKGGATLLELAQGKLAAATLL